MTPSDFLLTGPLPRLSGAVAQAARTVAGFARTIAHRRRVQSLLELDERALKDIGLLRNDVLGALAQPLFTDPSTVLLIRSVERRARARTSPMEAERPDPVCRPRHDPARL
jgi:uncharacterized protein YjiS (DUF1127 family)